MAKEVNGYSVAGNTKKMEGCWLSLGDYCKGSPQEDIATIHLTRHQIEHLIKTLSRYVQTDNSNREA